MCWIGLIVSCNVNMGFVRFPYLAQARPQSRLSLAGGTLVLGKGGSVETVLTENVCSRYVQTDTNNTNNGNWYWNWYQQWEFKTEFIGNFPHKPLLNFPKNFWNAERMVLVQ